MRFDPDCTGRWKCLHTARQVADGGDETRRDVPRMRTGEPDATNAADRADPLQEGREVTGRVVRRLVVIDDLPEQLHFDAAGVGGALHLGENVADGTHPLVPARVRHAHRSCRTRCSPR